MINNEYNPFRTALQRHKVSLPTSILLDKGLIEGKILDYGCGYGFDTIYLKDKGYYIVGYDKYNTTYNKPSILEDEYDTIICNYVLNVIDLKTQNYIINKLKSIGKNIYITVRSDIGSVKDNWEYISSDEYYRTSKNTYQRFYTEEMIYKYFGQVEYISNTNKLKIFKIKKIK